MSILVPFSDLWHVSLKYKSNIPQPIVTETPNYIKIISNSDETQPLY